MYTLITRIELEMVSETAEEVKPTTCSQPPTFLLSAPSLPSYTTQFAIRQDMKRHVQCSALVMGAGLQGARVQAPLQPAFAALSLTALRQSFWMNSLPMNGMNSFG